MYRMIAIDLDGTLLSPSGEVSGRTKTAVRRALDAGLLVCFATGRSWTESRLVLEAVAHYPTAVFSGGAMIVDTQQQIVLHQMKMEPSLAAGVCGVMESAGHSPLALQDVLFTGIDYLVSEVAPLHPASKSWLATMNNAFRAVPKLGDDPHEHTVRVGAVGLITEMATLRSQLIETFGERVLCHSLAIPGQNIAVLEVFDPAVNKWQGILLAAERHGVRPEQIIAIGDDVNDLAMIENAGLGVAMGNARPEVLAIADLVVGSNADDGLAEFLDQLVDQGKVAPPPN